jgi:hypothetical protein
LLAWSGSFFNPEDGGNILLRNVCKFLSRYTASRFGMKHPSMVQLHMARSGQLRGMWSGPVLIAWGTGTMKIWVGHSKITKVGYDSLLFFSLLFLII